MGVGELLILGWACGLDAMLWDEYLPARFGIKPLPLPWRLLQRCQRKSTCWSIADRLCKWTVLQMVGEACLYRIWRLPDLWLRGEWAPHANAHRLYISSPIPPALCAYIGQT